MLAAVSVNRNSAAGDTERYHFHGTVHHGALIFYYYPLCIRSNCSLWIPNERAAELLLQRNKQKQKQSERPRTARGTHAPPLPTGRPPFLLLAGSPAASCMATCMWDDRPAAPGDWGIVVASHAITAGPAAAAKLPGQVRRCRSSLQRAQCHRRLVAYASSPMQIVSSQVALSDSHREDDGGWPPSTTLRRPLPQPGLQWIRR